MVEGSYQFADFAYPEKEMQRLKLQANIMESQELLFLKNAGLTDNKKVLDLGCGLGDTLRLMQKNFSNLDLYGTDVNESFLARCKESFKDMSFFQQSVYELSNQEETFDFVYARFVFQHLTDSAKALQEIYKILKPNGILVILDVDDSYYHLAPPSKELALFFQIAEEAQLEKGGDRRVGHKLKNYFYECKYQNVIEIKKIISSQSIGLVNFLNITTGLKLEHINESKKTLATRLLHSAYAKAIQEESVGELHLFGVRGQKSET